MHMKLSGKQWTLVLAGVVLVVLVILGPGGGNHSTVSDNAPTLGGLGLRAGGSLMIIVALMLAAAWFVRRLGITPSLGLRKKGTLHVEEQVGLAGRQMLYVVRYGSLRYLVASGQQGVSLVSRIKEVPAGSLHGEREEGSDEPV